jgi:hypothetical protein
MNYPQIIMCLWAKSVKWHGNSILIRYTVKIFDIMLKIS